MSDIPSIPESISHKRLSKLFSNAKKELQGDNSDAIGYQEETLEDLLSEWGCISHELIRTLRESESHLKEIKNSKSLLALGAMEAHINMALQALKASEKED